MNILFWERFVSYLRLKTSERGLMIAKIMSFRGILKEELYETFFKLRDKKSPCIINDVQL